jgi:hypothetical protein
VSSRPGLSMASRVEIAASAASRVTGWHARVIYRVNNPWAAVVPRDARLIESGTPERGRLLFSSLEPEFSNASVLGTAR